MGKVQREGENMTLNRSFDILRKCGKERVRKKLWKKGR